MAKNVLVHVTSSGKTVSIEEKHAVRMAKAAPKEYKIMELEKIEVTAIPEKKSVGLAGRVELNAGTAVPTALKPDPVAPHPTHNEVLTKKKK